MSNSEQSSVVVVIRALLQSASSSGLTLQELENDYRNLEGVPVPFVRFGYKTVGDFLRSTGEFIYNGRKITHKEVPESMHISRLVKQQRTVSKKKKFSHPMAPRPIRSSTMDKRRRCGNPLNGKAITAKSIKPIQPLMSSKVQPPNRCYVSEKQQYHQQTNNGFNNNNHNNNASVPFDRIATNNMERHSFTKQSNFKTNKQSNATGCKTVPSTSKLLSMSSKTNIKCNELNQPEVAKQPIQTIRVQNRFKNTKLVALKSSNGTKILALPDSTRMPSLNSTGYNLKNQNNQPVLGLSTKSTISNRLLQFHNDNGKTPTSPIVTNHTKSNLSSRLAQSPATGDVVDFLKTTPIIKSPNEIKFDELEKLNSIEALSTFCLLKGYTQPQYKYFEIRAAHKIQCNVTVNNVIHSTYPNQFNTKRESQLNAANVALQQIKNVELSEKYPYCLDISHELAIKIFRIIRMTPNGVITKEIPQKFQEAYKQTLPDNWLNIINDYPQMFNNDTIAEIKIIYPNCLESLLCSRQPGEQSIASANITKTIKNDLPSKLILPWSDKHWNVFITNTVSTDEVWARIIGPNYSDKLDSLLTAIESDFFIRKQVANQILIGKIYLVLVSECWYRVRIERRDAAQNRALCFFIDAGDVDWFPINKIYHCDLKFVNFPAQAICLRLSGLEDFAENPNAKQNVDKYLAGKSLTAEILTKSDEYQLEVDSGDLGPKIRTILYDTSSDEDIHLNSLISKKIGDEFLINKYKIYYI